MRGAVEILDKNKIKSEYLNEAYSDIADLLGMDAALKMHSAFRGQTISFPVDFFSKRFIHQQIIDEYDGYNVKQLATKYGYSEKWVKMILKNHIDQLNK